MCLYPARNTSHGMQRNIHMHGLTKKCEHWTHKPWNMQHVLMRQMHSFAHDVCLLSTHNALGPWQLVIQMDACLTLAIPFLWWGCIACILKTLHTLSNCVYVCAFVWMSICMRTVSIVSLNKDKQRMKFYLGHKTGWNRV